MDKAERWLTQTLGYSFNDVSLLRQALTHRSAQGTSNERLEFLGDAVLDIVVSEVLFHTLPDAPEGDLSRLRASLVRDTTLAGVASDLGMGDHLILGSGERKTGGHRRESILADALEALFGAVYLDSDFDTSAGLIRRVFAEKLDDLPHADDLRDPKTRLQEWLQARGASPPDYELVNVSGKAHQQHFEVRCLVPDQEPATGEGRSRRSAEQQAARHMLGRLTEGG
ncbi:MAG: ribonuclease III [Gammaproteobacteria bacterium]|nr:ribonuclease III [Gammaproteobacteria bacterium]